jgi:hypothetical protein
VTPEMEPAITGEAYTLVLRPVVSPRYSTSGELRLRAALKTLLRGYGLRCVSVRLCQPQEKKQR